MNSAIALLYRSEITVEIAVTALGNLNTVGVIGFQTELETLNNFPDLSQDSFNEWETRIGL